MRSPDRYEPYRRTLRDRAERLSRAIHRLKADLEAWRFDPRFIRDPRPELRRAQQRIDAVHRAEQRIRDGNFGRCGVCGRTIEPSLLRRDPTRAVCDRHTCIAPSAKPRHPTR